MRLVIAAFAVVVELRDAAMRAASRRDFDPDQRPMFKKRANGFSWKLRAIAIVCRPKNRDVSDSVACFLPAMLRNDAVHKKASEHIRGWREFDQQTEGEDASPARGQIHSPRIVECFCAR